jgi:hypothetical protein
MPALLARVLLLVNVTMLLSSPGGARPQAIVENVGLSGYVLSPDRAPVSGGTVVLRMGMALWAASIDPTGRFRVVPSRSGVHQLVVRVPGFAPFRLMVTVPGSRSLRLPVIRLSPGAYFRVRLVTADGQPILAPHVRQQPFDASGGPIADTPGDQVSDPGDGAVTIGPLARGAMALAVDMPFFAQTRLPNLNITDPTRNLDLGTVVIQQPGAVLNVDLVDGAGAPCRITTSASRTRVRDHRSSSVRPERIRRGAPRSTVWRRESIASRQQRWTGAMASGSWCRPSYRFPLIE